MPVSLVCQQCQTVYSVKKSKEHTSHFCSVPCRAQYQKSYPFHKSKPPEERFWPKVKKLTPHECWEWQARQSRFGYGSFDLSHPRKNILAHRFAWELTHGLIPEGLQVLHKCDNPPCVNPAHLFLGTNADNMADMKRKGRRKGITVGEKASNAVLTNKLVEEIRATKDIIPNVQWAKWLNVTGTCIYEVRSYKSWKHLP